MSTGAGPARRGIVVACAVAAFVVFGLVGIVVAAFLGPRVGAAPACDDTRPGPAAACAAPRPDTTVVVVAGLLSGSAAAAGVLAVTRRLGGESSVRPGGRADDPPFPSS